MNEQIYKLLITVLGALIPGLFGIINTIITVRAKSGQGIAAQPTNRTKPQPTKPVSEKRRPRMLLFIVLIAVGAAFGYYIGNRTKTNPNIVKLYAPEEQISVADETMMDIEFQINELEQEKARIWEQPEMPEPEKEAMIQRFNEKIRQLTMKKAEYEGIVRQVRIPEDRLEP